MARTFHIYDCAIIEIEIEGIRTETAVKITGPLEGNLESYDEIRQVKVRQQLSPSGSIDKSMATIKGDILYYEVDKRDYINKDIYEKIPKDKLQGEIPLSMVMRKHYLGGLDKDNKTGELIIDYFYEIPEIGDDIDNNVVIFHDHDKVITNNWIYIISHSIMNKGMFTFHRDKKVL
jgi:hypothetical protein